MSAITNVKMNTAYKKMNRVPKGWPSPKKTSMTNMMKNSNMMKKK